MKISKNNVIMAGSLLCVLTIICVTFIILFKKSEAEPENEKKEITKLSIIYASGDSGWNRAVNLVGEAFSQKYPDILIELQPSANTPRAFYDDFLRKKAATDELGDITEIKSINTVIDYQLFVPLPKELTNLVEDKWTAPNGAVYTLPLFKSEQGIIYNKDVFRAIGAKPPKTWQEFEALSEKLKKKNYMPLVVGANDIWHLKFWGRYFFNSCVSSVNSSWQQDCTLGKVKWTDKEPKKMIKRFLELFEKGYVHPDYARTSDAAACEYIADGRAVMLYALSNHILNVQNLNPQLNLGWFFMPDDKGQRYSYYDRKSGWAITAECKADKNKYDAAIKFLNFFYSKEIYGQICEIMNALPITREMVTIENKFLKEISSLSNGVIESDIQIGDEYTPEGFDSFLYKELMETIEGKKTKEQMLENLQSNWKRRS